MSKIGKKPIAIPEGVTVTQEGERIRIAGKLGALEMRVIPFVSIAVNGQEILVEKQGNTKQAHANWGTMRALLANMIMGIHKGFEKMLEIEGVGYRAIMDGKDISLSLGYAHPVKFVIPEGITAKVEKNTITIAGIDKELVGQTAVKLRALKKPEPYKGKGIRYRGEVIRRKAGKKVAGSGA